METNQGTEPRFEGCNWDKPAVKVKLNGATTTTLRRKVLTNGVKHLYMGGLLDQMKERLRQGYEVRICDSAGNDAIRVFPFALGDCKTMVPKAQAMGDFAKECYSGIKIGVTKHYGKEIGDSECNELSAKQAKRYEAAKAEPYATPDLMVSCPQCGFRFRVGRSMKE